MIYTDIFYPAIDSSFISIVHGTIYDDESPVVNGVVFNYKFNYKCRGILELELGERKVSRKVTYVRRSSNQTVFYLNDQKHLPKNERETFQITLEMPL